MLKNSCSYLLSEQSAGSAKIFSNSRRRTCSVRAGDSYTFVTVVLVFQLRIFTEKSTCSQASIQTSDEKFSRE